MFNPLWEFSIKNDHALINWKEFQGVGVFSPPFLSFDLSFQALISVEHL